MAWGSDQKAGVARESEACKWDQIFKNEAKRGFVCNASF